MTAFKDIAFLVASLLIVSSVSGAPLTIKFLEGDEGQTITVAFDPRCAGCSGGATDSEVVQNAMIDEFFLTSDFAFPGANAGDPPKQVFNDVTGKGWEVVLREPGGGFSDVLSLFIQQNPNNRDFATLFFQFYSDPAAPSPTIDRSHWLSETGGEDDVSKGFWFVNQNLILPNGFKVIIKSDADADADADAPEPGTIALLIIGLAGIGMRKLRALS